MLFNSIEYLFIFLPIVFCIYFFLNKIKLYNIAKFFLLIASLYFYGSYKVEYVPILISLILFNYLISFSFKFNITNKIKKSILICGVIGNILILLYFKYFNFLIEEISKITNFTFNTMEVILPLGISFFTLQQISYIIDCFKEKVKNYNLLDYSLFICFFPQLIAGPIVRHQEMIPQFRDLRRRVISQENIFIGIFLITIGLFKKTVFADNFVPFLNCVTEMELYNEFYIVWTMAIAKLLQVYFDFSGYCDIALGSAFLFNISLPWNFNSPFKATSIVEFWKRWNITFIRFLKDYVYKPLGSDKNGIYFQIRNILIMFLIIGLWIGNNFMGILYGIFNGIFVSIEYLFSKLKIKINIFFSRILTLLSLIFTVQCMLVKNYSELITVIKTMFGIDAIYHFIIIKNFSIVFGLMRPHSAKFDFIPFLLSIIIVLYGKNSMELARIYIKRYKPIYTFILAILFLIAVLSITRSNEFVYFSF